jgi:dipeptidyl aminopeptidase/acylaminoacyl peptidase
MMGGRPEQAAARYRERSPINFVDRIRGRVLVVHGLRDTNVSARNTELGCRALERAGVRHELVTYPDEGHGIWKTSTRADLFRRMARFFADVFDEPPQEI